MSKNRNSDRVGAANEPRSDGRLYWRTSVSCMESAAFRVYDDVAPGEVAERPIAPVLKTGVGATRPRVRIPASPLFPSRPFGEEVQWLSFFRRDALDALTVLRFLFGAVVLGALMAGKVVALCVIAALGALALGVSVALRFQAPLAQGELRSSGSRLLAHSRDREDYRLFVGVPPANPTDWAEVTRIDDSSVTFRNSPALDLSVVSAFFVAYPGGALADWQRTNGLALPDWVTFPNESGPPDHDRLVVADLKQGRSLVRVDFGKSTSKPKSPHHYSTILTNVSGRRVRVLKFAGYTKDKNGFSLNTITSRFFTAEDFKEWYGQAGEWIGPGQSLTDPNNYGSPPCLWAYYCMAEDGEAFLTGGVIK